MGAPERPVAKQVLVPMRPDVPGSTQLESPALRLGEALSPWKALETEEASSCPVCCCVYLVRRVISGEKKQLSLGYSVLYIIQLKKECHLCCKNRL